MVGELLKRLGAFGRQFKLGTPELFAHADTVEELLKRLDGFGRQEQLGTPGVRLFRIQNSNELRWKGLQTARVVNWSWARQG